MLKKDRLAAITIVVAIMGLIETASRTYILAGSCGFYQVTSTREDTASEVVIVKNGTVTRYKLDPLDGAFEIISQSKLKTDQTTVENSDIQQNIGLAVNEQDQPPIKYSVEADPSGYGGGNYGTYGY